MSTVQINQTMADNMVKKAISLCAEESFAGDVQRALRALRQGRCDICGGFSDCLVKQISEYLGQMDKTVKAVYKYEPTYTLNYPNGDVVQTPGPRWGINLVAWVERKSAALTSLGTTLETVLSASKRKIGCSKATPACYTLDVEMVDDKDVQERRGYGVVVGSEFVYSTPVWTRTVQIMQYDPTELDEPTQIAQDSWATFDHELAPESRLIEQAIEIERLPPEERAPLEHRLIELRVTLIRRIISDQLAYIDIAKKWFTTEDLANIHQRKIGYGKVGGKSAGMLLAARILSEVADEEVLSSIHIPESYFIGSDLIYIFMAMNGLMHWNDQKYKPGELLYAEYPQIQREFQAGKFPPEVVEELQGILESVGPKPLIVRSSSQLEDNFGTSFAGKYNSYFCPNQGSPKENLQALTNAISRTYASTLNPGALLYRRSKGLQDYDERMAVLVQVVQGEQFERYYFPFGAGVAFSRNIYRWSPQIRREDGFARLVWGLGTRAVERVGDDYPRLVALSHPTLQPDDSAEAIRRYSQRYIDIIDLEENSVKTLLIQEVMNPRYPGTRLLTQIEQGGFFTTPRMRVSETDMEKLAITYHEFLRRTRFAPLLSKVLHILEKHYHSSVDMEFTVRVPEPQAIDPQIQISLLQCRPQSYLPTTVAASLPEDLSCKDIVFSTEFMVPQGYLPNIRYILFVDPEVYFTLPSAAERNELRAMISHLNTALREKSFICIGPGRWGSTNTDLGVYVNYADIHQAGALVELTGGSIGLAPEPSLGTHFFQDLMEAQIYPLAIDLDDENTTFNREFFYDTPNKILEWVDVNESLSACLRLIEISSIKPEHHLDLVMDDEKNRAVAFLDPDELSNAKGDR